MTAIDGARQPGTIAGLVSGATLDRLDELARLTGRSPAEIAALAIADYTPAISTKAGPAYIAPPVETRSSRGATPGDGRGAGVAATSPAPVSAAAPAHVHLGGGPCVYGERCGQ